MRKKIFHFFALLSTGLFLLTVFIFTELSYVGVKIQYFLITALIVSILLSWLFYKPNSDYFG